MKLGYLVSRYPAVSHTFIMREVVALRAHGFDVDTFTVRAAKKEDLLADADRAEAGRTTAILPAGPLRLIGAHLSLLLTRPGGYFSALGMALRSRNPGLRAAIWHLFYFLEAAILARRLCQRGVGHLHVHFANVASEVAMLAARMRGITWSLTLHGLSDFGNPALSRLREKIESATFVVSVSDWGRAQAKLCTDAPNWPKLHVVRCGIDVNRFVPAGRSGGRHGEGQLRVLTVGRLSPEKGHAVLLDALEQVTREGVNVECTIVGAGPLHDELVRRTDELGLTDRVTFTGAVGQDDILHYYQNADVFVLSSLAEGLPVVLMEAMAAGLPVVASNLTGIPELITHGQQGLLVVPGRADQLAEAIVRLAREPAKAQAMAAVGRARVNADFDISRTVEVLVRVIESVILEHDCGNETAPLSTPSDSKPKPVSEALRS